ncbi:hypothetical protein D3C76_1617550 [compost metagenome]
MTALRRDNLSGQKQPDADPLEFTRLLSSVKPLKDVRDFFAGDSKSSIGKVETGEHLVAFSKNGNLSVMWCVLHSILEQVE